MNDFTLYSPDTTPPEVQPLMAELYKKLGYIPNLYAGLAAAPTVLKAALELSTAFSHTSLTQQEQVVVSLAASVENGCEFCVAAHSFVARHVAKLEDASIAALRAGHALHDPKLEALARFTRHVVNQRGWVAGSVLQAFLEAGYSHAQVLEVILGVALKTLTNYANHMLHTPLNPQLSSERWETA